MTRFLSVIGRLIGAVALVGLAVLWVRGRHAATSLVTTGFGGRGVAVVVGDGVIYFAGTTARTTPAWSAFAGTNDLEQMADTHAAVDDVADHLLGDRFSSPPGPSGRWPRRMNGRRPVEFSRTGFAAAWGTNAFGIAGARWVFVSAPVWAVEFLVGLVLLRSGLRWRTVLLRRRRGWCVSCGYDLRQSPGRCPECGAIPSVRRSAGV